jgi:MoaA/NifB/PqqE/SkfB family radical SAM enzyme
MEPSRDLNAYLNQGAEKLIADILRATLKNPRETVFLQRFHRQQVQMEKRRLAYEAEGIHIPLFLIASITGACNLACKGCYARANGLCGEKAAQNHLSAAQWGGIFDQAQEAGIPFILLAGGEPFLRPDVLKAAAEHDGILFPVFTNGTMVEKGMLNLLDRHRNVKPVISLEGGKTITDARRGEGVFALTQKTLESLRERKLLFGVSLTVTTENIGEVTSPEFLTLLFEAGCRMIFFIEYVPVAPGTEYLALGEEERERLEQAQDELREQLPGMIFLSFPGDEKHMGGCLAAGRGFFHINPSGGAEPCPFSPYSDMSLKEHTLLQALGSPFFRKVRELNAQDESHAGGCALFAKEAQVRGLLFP